MTLDFVLHTAMYALGFVLLIAGCIGIVLIRSDLLHKHE